MVGMLHSNAFNEEIKRNPYAFQKFGVTQVRQSLNGEEYPYRTLQLTGTEAYEDLLGYDRFLQAMGAYNENKISMLLPSDWGQEKSCTLFLFNNVPSGKAHDPQYRNPRQSRSITTSPCWCGASMKTCMRSIIYSQTCGYYALFS